MNRIYHRRRRPSAYNRDSYTLFSRRKKFPFSLVLVLFFVFLIIAYAVFDNSRITLKEHTVHLPGLSAEMEGYDVLHFSNLYGKFFGERQEKVQPLLERADFDVVLISGNVTDPKQQSPQAFYQLLEMLQQMDKPVYFVCGNDDPAPVSFFDDGTWAYSLFVQEAMTRGAVYLDAPQRIGVGDGFVSLYPADMMVMDPNSAISLTKLQQSTAKDGVTIALCDYQLSILQQLQQVQTQDAQEDLVLALSAQPYPGDQIARLRSLNAGNDMLINRVDMIVSGSYEGVEWKLPFGGPIYIRHPWLTEDRWFSGKEWTEGVVASEGIAQFISRGMASARPGILPFRLFSTGQMAVITLSSHPS